MNQLQLFQSTKNAPEFASEAAAAYACLEHLVEFYPDFEAWYWGKVVPGLTDGTRMLRTVVRDRQIVAALIAKRTDAEKKLCTLWVAPRFIGTGIGVRLINAGRDWVGTQSPVASVPEERMQELSGILAQMGFELTETVESAYRPRKKEYVFNGRLSRISG